MALYSQTDFAELCGVSSAYLSVNKKRGKIVLSGNYVDDKIEPNVSFLKKCQDKINARAQSETELIEVSEDIIGKEYERIFPKAPNVKSPTLIKRAKPNVQSPKHNYTFEIDNEKKLVDTENSRLLQKIRVAKLNQVEGATIPTDMVGNLIATHFRNFTTSFKNAMDNSLTRWSKHFTPEEMIDAKKHIIAEINKAVDRAIAETSKGLQEIITISSNKKEVGERE